MTVNYLPMLLGLLLLATACTSPAPSPPAPVTSGPQAPPPATPAPPVGCIGEAAGLPAANVTGYWNALHGDLWVANGTCARSIHVDLTEVSFHLPVSTTEPEARAALKLSGDLRGEPYVRFAGGSSDDRRWLTVRLPDGQVGDRITARLEGPLGPAGEAVSLGFNLERRPSPTIAAEIKDAGGDWVPLPAGASLRQDALDLRLLFTGGLSAEQAADRLVNSAQGAKVTVTRQEANLVEARAEGSPARLSFSFSGVQGDHGLSAGESALTLYLGAPPYVAVLDPVSGKEEGLVEAPADVEQFSRSPDGQWLLFKARDPNKDFAYTYYLADLATGKGRWLPVTFQTWQYGLNPVWQRERLLLPDQRQIHSFPLPHGAPEVQPSLAEDWGTASPDGRYWLGWQLDPAPWSGTDRRITAALILRDLQTREERRFPSAVVTSRPFESPPYVEHTWAGDGNTLVMRHMLNGQDARIARLDLLSGQVEVTDQPWTREGVEPETWKTGPSGWQYLTTYPWEWRHVQVRPSGGGPVREHGSGMILGWTAQGKLLVLRWENVPNRRPHAGH